MIDGSKWKWPELKHRVSITGPTDLFKKYGEWILLLEAIPPDVNPESVRFTLEDYDTEIFPEGGEEYVSPKSTYAPWLIKYQTIVMWWNCSRNKSDPSETN